MESGISPQALQRYIDEQVFTLPGVLRPEETFTILLTGSRATGTHAAGSDVDIDVLCPREVYESVQSAALAGGRITSTEHSFYILRDADWQRYFGTNAGRPHFSLTPLDDVARHFREFEDILIWIWTHGKVISDPHGQFQRILDGFSGYPRDVLVRKIKYRWMLTSYWAIEVYPHHHSSDTDLLPAGMSILNAVHELYRFFFLVEGKPFPYTEKLPRFVGETALGREFMPFLGRMTDLVVGGVNTERDPWARLDEASRLVSISDESAESCRLEEACAKAMLAAGVEPPWVEADYSNITELFSGKLGPLP